MADTRRAALENTQVSATMSAQGATRAATNGHRVADHHHSPIRGGG